VAPIPVHARLHKAVNVMCHSKQHPTMTKTSTLFLSVCILVIGCNQPNSKKDDTSQHNSADYKADIIKLNDVLRKYEEPSQVFSVSADKPSVLTGRKGTKISIDPNDLITESGKPLGKNIEVELKELVNQGQLLRSNAQTISDGRLLISGGAYFIGMTSNGERLRLKDGKKLIVQFPKLSDKEMALFYGQRNDFGQMNWQKASETFKQTRPPVNVQPSDPVSEKPKPKSDIEAIMDYVDSGYNPTPEEKERSIQQRRNDIVSQKFYDEIGINKLEWINCDRFWEVENTTELYASFNPQDSIKNANVYLIFKDINSVIHSNYFSDKLLQFENVPRGYKVRLVAYTVKDERVFAYSTEFTITKGLKLTLSLEETSENDFRKLIKN
jgi:hypothetical protein